MQCCDEKKTCEATPVALTDPIPVPAGSEQAVFLIQKMDCPTEEKLIRDRFRTMNGVLGLEFNLMQRQLTVRHSLTSTLALLQGLTELGLDPVLKSDTLDPAATGSARDSIAADYRIPASKWIMMAVSGVAAFGSEAVAWSTGNEHGWPVVALAFIAVAAGGRDTLRKGAIALRHLSLNMNFLMSLAVIGACTLGQWPEAAVVICLFSAAEMIEALSVDRARNAIKQLMAMTPDTATIQGRAGEWVEMPASTVAIGAVARVKPGERLALDGVVTSGQTTVNQAPITGESMPVPKQVGDSVFAGTINE